jgi:putative ABC transport system permease protein
MIPVRYNVRSLAVRKTTTIATAAGIGLVVFVLASSLMLAAGVRKTLGLSGRRDVALVMRKGSDAELGSSIEDPQVGLLGSLSGVRRGPRGALVSGEVIVVAAMEKLGASGVSNVQLRGMTEQSHELRPQFKLVSGRLPRAGADEVLVGQRLRGRFRGLDLDGSFDLRKNRPVKVVGFFSDGGSSYESEVWVDLDVLRTSYRREGFVSSVRVQLESEGKFDGFQALVERDKRLGLQAMREATYFEKQSEGTSLFITVMGSVVSVFFALGAMIGAMITMYAAVASRQREIGTLRALGFSRSAVLGSFLLESVLLATAGGVMGAAASVAMGTVHFSMINYASWSEVVFRFEPTAAILGQSVGFAAVMGLVGGLLPAVRAARIAPAVAMRG